MDNLIEKTKKELQDIAKSLGLKGISKLSKSELIELIESNKKDNIKLIENKEKKELLSKLEKKELLPEFLLSSKGYYEEKASYNEM